MSDSGFSAEDLISDLLGFYRTVNPKTNYIAQSRPVPKSAAEKIWDTYGAIGDYKNKNIQFQPMLFPCAECTDNPPAKVLGTLPEWLRRISPAKNGDLFRDWDYIKDESLLGKIF